ncbi:MAG: hypothetical protein GMKNLPBB_00888 [Myxococcota bacterium]|nr:hypothetical protein [Myxococcota bacterium]
MSPPGGTFTLDQAPAGERLIVVSVDASRSGRIARLAGLGLVPGCELILRQRKPALVVDMGETTLALDELVARAIMVTPLG